jgi:hypothetical protein
MIKPRKVRCTGHVACITVIRNVHKIFFGKPEGKRSLARPRHSCEDNITINL